MAVNRGKLELYLSCYEFIENSDPKDSEELSDMIEDIIFAVQDVMYDYAKDRGWYAPEPFI